VTTPRFDHHAIFDEDYLYFYAEVLDERADAEADLIWRLLELEPGMEVLDLACGHGRISNRLAERGVRVTGLDGTPLFLEYARRDAAERGIEVDYVEGDMRELPWEGAFDRVISWFTSFGYFDDQTNRAVLGQVHEALRPGGAVLIEGNNLAELLPRWLPETVLEKGDDMVVDRYVFEPVTGRADTERTVVRNGQVRRFSMSVRMFVAAELGDWLREAGFDEVRFYDREGELLTAAARRMIAIASR
jgi:cyclopropane fatty-acyl-phospholipid synthase-like methyltransferase